MPRSVMQRVRLGGGADGGTIVPLWVQRDFVLPGALPATAANWGSPFFMPYDDTWQLVAVLARHETAGNDAGAVTIMLKKTANGAAASSGTDMLSAAISMKATARTIQVGALSATVANLQLTGSSESAAFVLTGTPTTLAGVCIETIWKKL